ncbi:sortase [Candidatus Parcubacteria bacterium]|nr:sortase [Candidatus Parcubacteria bacterium]
MSQYPEREKISFLDLVWKFKFLLLWYVICIGTVTFAVLYALGGVPDELKVQSSTEVVPSPTPRARASTSRKPTPTPTPKPTASINSKGELPKRIIIEKIGVNAVVNTPPSTDNAVLNDYLLRGVVRYPGSGTLGYGNTFLFGHSSSLKVINNQAYKIFTKVRELNVNDKIRVQSAGKEYVYKVTAFSLVESDEAFVDLTSTRNMITLVTCNVFGQKEERFIVEASFVSSRTL